MDIESNQGVINQPANLTPDTANKSLEISQQLGIDVDPVKNFTEVQKLNSDISPEATSLRSVANESNENASLIKKDAKQLSDLEKYSRNIKLKIKSDDLRDQANSLILKQSELRKTNKDLTEDEMFELDRLELMNEEIQIQQEQLGLNMTESALTGDLVGVFRDMGVQAKESPVISGLGALGFIGGPGLGVTTMLLANTAAGVPYNYDRTFAQTYRDLEGQRDDNGNELPNDLKIGIARVSAGAQTFLETGSELVMTGAGKLWGKYVSKGAGKAASGVAEKALEKAAKNPKFREKILAIAGDVSKAGLSEAVTEVLQDMISDTAVNTGKGWNQAQGLDITKGVEKTIENLDFSRVWETGYRSAITGGAANVGFRGGQKVLDKGVNAWYERKNGKRLNIDENNNVVEEDVPPTTPPPSGPTTFNGKEPATKLPTNRNTSFALVPEIDGGKTKEELKQDPGNQRKTVLMKDGEPKNLSRNEAILLGVVKSNSDTASDYGIGENQIALEKLQLEEAEKNGLNVMFVDKESLEDWATTDEHKKAIADLFLGDKGAYLGKQKVPLTKKQYYMLQGFGDKEFLNDSTSITSDGMTLGQLKDVIKQLGDKAKNLPKPSGIESSPEQNTAGKVDLSTSGVNVPTDTTHLGVDSTDQEIVSTLNNQQQADSYLKRLADEEAALGADGGQQVDPDTTKLGPDSTDEEIINTLKNKKQADAYLGRLVNDIKAVHDDKSIKGTPIIHYSPNKFAKNKSDYVWGYNKDAPISSMYGSNRYEYTLTEDANIVKIEDIPSDFTDLDNPSDAQKKYFKDNNIDAILRHSVDGLDQIVVVNKDKLDQSKTERLYNLTTIFDRVAKLIPDLPNMVDNEQSNNSERIEQIKRMRERVEALKGSLPDEPLFTPDIDTAIDKFENFGDITEGLYDLLPESEREFFRAEITRVKELMKRNFKDEIMTEFDETATIAEREANIIAQDEAIDAALNDDRSIIVDSFLADRKALRIDYDTLSDEQKAKFNKEDGYLKKRKVFKAKDGMHIEEVAAQMGVESDVLLDALANALSTEQSVQAKVKVAEARNKAESRKQTDINFEAIENTINDVTKLKRDMLNTILKTNPNAAMKLMYSIFKAGAQTTIENVNINAKDLTENTRIGNLKPSSYLNASRRHFNSAIRSILKTKDLAQGSKNIEQSMIADELHKASRVTKRKVDRVIDSIMRKYGDKRLLSQLDATGHIDAFKAVLSLIGKGKINEGDMGSLKQLMIEWTEKGIESDSNLPATLTESEAIQESVARDKEVDINDLTFSQLETVNSILNQIVQDSNNARKDRITDQRLYENGTVQAAKDDVANNPYKDGSKAKSYSKGGSGWIKESLNTLLGIAHTIKMNDDMIDWFKISNDGLLGNLWKQIKGVGVFANGMGEQGYNQLSAKVKDLLNESIGAKNWKRLQSYAGQRIYVPEFANTDGLLGRDGMIRKTNLIGMLLVYGSKEGRNRLSKFGLDMDTLIPTIEKYLHKDDIKIVEAIWKAHDFLKPGIAYVEKTLRGVNNVEFIEPEPFIWNGKEVSGGYIHLTYSTDQKTTLTIKEKDVIADLLGDENIVNSNNATRDFTREGFKKARAQNLDMYLNLDLNTMMNSSLNNIITNNTMLIPIYNTMRLLNNKEIENQYIQVMGKDAFAIFKKNVLQSGMNQDAGMLDNIKSWSNLGNVIGYVSSNFMKSKIYSSVSSIFNQFLSFVTIAGKHATEPSILVNTGIFWLKMVANPKSVRTLINELAEHMPSIKTDIASYAQTTVRSFKLIEGSESGNRLIRGFVNANNTLGDLWLSKIMGGLDEFNKTAYALALLQKYHNGKLGTDKAKLNEMGDVERKNEGFAKVDKMVRQIFPDKNITSSSYAQNNRLISQFLPFFNDARRTLNSVYFPRLRDMWEAVTLFPEDVAKRGLAKAAAKSTKDIVLNTIVLHVYASMIDALIGSFRGEDEEDDTKGDKEWPERVFDRAIRNLTDPLVVPKNIADNTPIVSGYKFFLETDARFGGVNLPIAQWGESAVKTAENLYNVGFNDGEMNDREMKDLMMTMSGLTLVPLSVVNNYIYGESTAFKTGFISTSILGTGVGVIAGVGAVGGLPLVAAGAALGVAGLGLGMYKDLGGLLSDAEKKVMKPSDNQELNAFNQSNYDALYESLLQDQNGRNQLISMVDKNEIAVISPEDLDNLIFVESKGDPLARPLDKNGEPLSSALGIGQFLIGTWNDVLKRHPELYGEVYPAYADETEIPDGEIDGRTDPQQTLKVLEYFHKDIWKALVKEGIRPYPDNIYTGHHFGEGMAAPLAKADDNQSLRSVFVKNVGVDKWNKTLRANGWLKSNMTVGEFREGINDLLVKGAIDKAKWESKNNIVFDPYNL